jgi:hypothetical protein
MITNYSTTIRDNKMSLNAYASLLNQGKVQEYALYRHIRARFLQQSALYLGANLNDREVLSLCFRDSALDTTQSSR